QGIPWEISLPLPPSNFTTSTNSVESLTWTGWIRHKFTKSRIPASVFQPRPSDHEKYGGDPQQPHKLHLVTRIKSGIGRPYWEKKIIHDLGLDKVYFLNYFISCLSCTSVK
uniref:Large ribosomal subunit protein uL30m n=1 Tax=Chrysemys picta bellii TaxID=8478 RepID=A0A8C3FC13_CHRPI